MSMWLSKKKKADLVDLCDELGLRFLPLLPHRRHMFIFDSRRVCAITIALS